ncbi:hypothetical protein ADK52_06230 [Streptomyces sp. WM6372]|uniref:hypothetical protein n=1 Tax=Streptomyces sp. WM6372 TaxID=1415555 RepID=UPI0006C1659B|nr:hypothetical protein [Streptomyces sp. WM6372]KOU29192.1 hypothetical protein ADK52_06230 [Streptomyces sp. WM6372]
MSASTPRTAVLAEPVAASGSGRRGAGRGVAVVVCAVLGVALLGGAGVSGWAEQRDAHRPLAADAAYRKAGSIWRETPVDSLFPPVLDGGDSGPGGADRTWTRVALAPDSDCAPALATDWRAALAATGCTRVLRATYTDSTRSSLVTVGMVFTPADAAGMQTLRGRLPAPPGYGFADSQRAAWTASVVPQAPVVVYTVSAFADGRTPGAPRPAEDMMRKDATGAVAQAGLGHEAKAVADRMERTVRTLAEPATSSGASR